MLLPGLALFAICLVASAAVVLTFLQTNPRIEKLMAEEKREAMAKVLPQAERFVPAKKKSISFDRGVAGGKVVGEVFSASVPGYSGNVEMEVGIRGGQVIGVEIVKETETPGLGTKVRDAEFLSQFRGKKATDPLEVREDVDAITGATISSRAVANGVRRALDQDAEVRK